MGRYRLPSRTILLRAEAAKSKKHLIIPMNATTRETLAAWKKQSGKDSGLVFVNPLTGKKFTNCNSAWESLLKAAQIENFRWHDMRHDFASRLVMNGVDLNTVRELLGHSDMKMNYALRASSPGNEAHGGRYAGLTRTQEKSAAPPTQGGGGVSVFFFVVAV